MQRLTDKEIKAAKPAAKAYKLWAGAGLYLLLNPNGSRLWRLKYSRGGREQLMALGAYPEITLTKARELGAAAKANLRAGGNPMTERLARRVKASLGAGETVEALTRAWHARQAPRWAPRSAAGIIATLERHVFPVLGKLHITDVTPPLMLACIRQIEQRGHLLTAHTCRAHMDRVFAEAISAGLVSSNPASQIRKTLAPIIRANQPALTALDDVRAMLRRIESEPAYPPTKVAFRLLALSACRPSEVAGAEWRELEDLKGVAPVWRIPPNRMKKRREHVVPLPPQAVAVIEALRPFTGHLKLLFPSMRSADQPMSRNTFLDVLYRCGFKGRHSAHGFRSSFNSIMSPRHPNDLEAIEAALAHVVGGTRGAYMRDDFLERRRELMAEWADLLLDGAPPAEALLYGPRR
jgi:integrase